ncbi:N-acetyl sugar amidotransferase [Runella slithyformis]|uniref:N-acetyl sugar amidotransferase n=1 Tax=Runella slithyformis (strain ATCC 29530 / DSM 19594 / LMG 11500 / NCIMB 11436 / LSU 4) TaxID=761193 RepID=A0A7U3ZN61_RUNSL|nr:N-acetyl sugar amidotransferase [Runella slithyformis]AEI50302.1 N-acetyl sugar amidotransferase [Runella slithyformis DSM 19594]
MQKKEIQICTKTVLDSTLTGISFDENGVSNFYYKFAERKQRLFITNSEEKQRQLNLIVESIKNKQRSKRYDCIVGVSGGIDSSYVIYKAIELGLRPLLVHFDNGWNSELAVANIESICKTLGVDLYTHVVHWHEFRDLQRSFLKASVANAEAPTDHGIFATLYNMAIKHDVKFILDGVNDATESITDGDGINGSGGYIYADLAHIEGIQKQFGTVQLKTYQRLSIYRKSYLRLTGKVRQISILNLLEYNKVQALETLIDKLGYRPYDGKHHESLFTKFHQGVYLPRKFGFDKRKLHLSDLIMSGQITRAEALEELKKPIIPHQVASDLIEYTRKKLGFSESEFNQILTAPPKSYDNYPNQRWIFDIYRWITSKTK